MLMESLPSARVLNFPMAVESKLKSPDQVLSDRRENLTVGNFFQGLRKGHRMDWKLLCVFSGARCWFFSIGFTSLFL
jgi:hypothetical protein